MNKIERIKAEKDGLDVYAELMRAAREGWETLADYDVALLEVVRAVPAQHAATGTSCCA